MATSLAQQLRKLWAPQTTILLQDKKRPSLLFDPKEAANLDRAIVLNIGHSGLQDSIKLCPSFSEFSETLFSPSSALLKVVQSLGDIVARQGKVLSPELEIIQQTALISLKLMARLLATEHPAEFKPVEIARKLGEDFMPLLPETVPFLAELLEDEDEGTEKGAQNAVRTLEEILGEPLQKYF